MKLASINSRLAGLGGDKWAVHAAARALVARGRDIIEMTIGEPDVPTPPELIACAHRAMLDGRTGYSDGRGEPRLREAIAARYSDRLGRPVDAAHVLCFPGTQTALYAVLTGLAERGDEVLVGDPYYATYESVIAASGATLVPVALSSEHGFRLQADIVESRLGPASRAILLNTPHNPTGAVLRRDDIAAIGALAIRHDLALIVDEVYEELVFDDVEFVSPLAFPELADRTVVVSSISKSHAAPGFRSGWCVGPPDFTAALLPLCEAMLFGNQPFIADMTALAVSAPSRVAADMRARLARRADRVATRLDARFGLRIHRPRGGMFVLMDVRALMDASPDGPMDVEPSATAQTTSPGEAYALDLLHEAGVAVMPGSSFGRSIPGWVRMALTIDDERIDEACTRILAHAAGLHERALAASAEVPG